MANLIRECVLRSQITAESGFTCVQLGTTGPDGDFWIRNTCTDANTNGAPSGQANERSDGQMGSFPYGATRCIVWYERFISVSTGSADRWQVIGPEVHASNFTQAYDQATLMMERSGTGRRRLNSNQSLPTPKYYDVGSITLNQVYAYKLIMKLTQGSDGFIQLWRDGTRVVNYTGPTIHGPTDVSGYWKQANYRSAANFGGSSIYDFSSTRIYDGDVTFAGMTAGGGGGGGPTPPPDPPPTGDTPAAPPDAAGVRFGVTAANGFYNSMQANSIRGSVFELTTPKKVTNYRCYIKGNGTTGTTQPMKVCLYLVNDGTYTNDSLVASSTSDEVSVASNAAGDWVDFPIADFNLAAGQYRICLHSGGTDGLTAYGYSTGTLAWANDTYAGGAQATFGLGTAIRGIDNTQGIAIYAVVAAPGTATALAGNITTETRSGLDLHFAGDLTTDPTESADYVAQVMEDVIVYRRTRFWQFDRATREPLYPVEWNGSRFVPADPTGEN